MRAVASSRAIARDPAVAVGLGGSVVHGLSKATIGDVLVGWGQKDNTHRAKQLAAKKNLPYWRLEDGFICYLSHPSKDPRRLSVIVDKSGIYYDRPR